MTTAEKRDKIHKPSKAVLAANRHRIFDAIDFATKAHKGQFRPKTNLPYISHPVGALAIGAQYGFSEEMLIAVLLHDVLEDTDTSISEIEKKFGPRVAHLVIACTDTCTDNRSIKWKPRKEKKLQYMRNKINGESMDELLVMCADKLHNIMSIRDNIKRAREANLDSWKIEINKRPIKEYQWYYSEMALAFLEILSVFAREVETVFGPLDEYQSSKSSP